jgi:hypothetical protein
VNLLPVVELKNLTNVTGKNNICYGRQSRNALLHLYIRQILSFDTYIYQKIPAKGVL